MRIKILGRDSEAKQMLEQDLRNTIYLQKNQEKIVAKRK